MRIHLIVVILFVVLASCDYNDIHTGIDTRPVVRETLIFETTGDKIWEKTFQYDGENRVLRAHTNMIGEGYKDSEIVYQYDAEGRVAKKVEGEIGGAQITTEYTYKNGLLESESSTISNSDDTRHVSYYYTGTLLDSIRTSYEYVGTSFSSTSTTRYKYDDNQRLIWLDGQQFEYDSRGRVAWTCFGKGGFGVADMCYSNEYNEVGQLVKIYLRLTTSTSETYLDEDYTYRGGKLTEKRKYSWFYKSTANGPDVFLTRYEY